VGAAISGRARSARWSITVPDALIYTLIGAGGAAFVAVAVATFAGSDGPTLTSEQLFKLEQQRAEMRHALLADQDLMGCIEIIGGLVLAFLLIAGMLLGGSPLATPEPPARARSLRSRSFASPEQVRS